MKISKSKLQRNIVDKIKASRNFLITAHTNLEGDALGSELAMYIMLKRLKKNAIIYNADATPSIYTFLPFSKVIKNSFKAKPIDVAMVLDCSDSSRSGKVKDVLSQAGCIINIDHHISNTYFGDINWVEPCVGSTAQILYELCERFKIMDKNIATCLYTGIFTDTGSFTYASTDSKTHEIVAKLMEYGLQPSKIYDNLHSLCDISDLGFISRIIASLKFAANGKICWALIENWEEKNYDITEIIFSIMRLLKGVEVFLLFKNISSSRTRVNFRSRSYFSVDKAAKFFGGGGHKRASGATVEDNIKNTEKKIISFIKKYFNGSKRT